MSMDNYTFYFTIGVDEWQPRRLKDDVAILLPASSYARHDFRRKVIFPECITRKAADCGGFIATFKWGDYKYSPDEYVSWLSSWQPSPPDWAATMDYCCEDEITNGRPGIVRERQQKTTGMAYRFWDDYKQAPWAWVPTIQGWEVADYQRHARDMRPLLLEMQAYYQLRDGENSQFRVGIGTLCRRVSMQRIIAIVMAIYQELPEVECFHLWGVKTGLWKSSVSFPFRTSSDSASWNMKAYFADRNPLWKRWKAEQALLGQQESNRSHRYKVLIPETQREIDASQSLVKQKMMF